MSSQPGGFSGWLIFFKKYVFVKILHLEYCLVMEVYSNLLLVTLHEETALFWGVHQTTPPPIAFVEIWDYNEQ